MRTMTSSSVADDGIDRGSTRGFSIVKLNRETEGGIQQWRKEEKSMVEESTRRAVKRESKRDR